MITARTKVQLAIFALITMVGVAFVGARYARLDRLVLDDSYRVVAHFAESGGIFEGAEVSYRGVTVGRVADMRLTESGVDLYLDIDNDRDDIPDDTRAVVANRSAVGEQFVDLQPRTDRQPFLREGSEIPTAMTATPISSTKLLTDLDRTVNSVNKRSLRTVVGEMGAAFNGTGEDLGRMIDTSSSFIRTANANVDLTTALLQDSSVVLDTQLDKASAIKSFARDLALFSDTLVASDRDLRTVVDNGSATANQLRRFLEANKVDLAELLNNLVTTGEITVKHLDAAEMLLILYPYVVAGGYVVPAKDPQTGLYDAHFGLVLQQTPAVCHKGYEGTDRRSPFEREDREMNTQAHCAEPGATTNARGAQHAPRARAGAAYRAPVVATYDPSTGKVSYTDRDPRGSVTYTGGAASAMGADSWKWLLLQPLAGHH